MSSAIDRRLKAIEKKVGTDEEKTQTLMDAELIVIRRMRLEGAGVWSEACGHVLYPLEFHDTRKAYEIMIRAQDEGIQKQIKESLFFCAKNDPYLLDANYPLLEYFLRVLVYICSDEKCFRPFKIPSEVCNFLLSIKLEEYVHYCPVAWCYECGYGYPAPRYSISHDILVFLKTRYTQPQIDAMYLPFKECVLCGGEIMRPTSSTSERWKNSPANRLRLLNKNDWMAEIDSVEMPEESLKYSFIPHGHGWNESEKFLTEDFLRRRGKQPTVRIEYEPSAKAIQRVTRGL